MTRINSWAIERILPAIASRWIDWTLRRHAQRAVRVVEFTSFAFDRFFSADTLDAARVIVVDRIPAPRLPRWLNRGGLMPGGDGPGPRGLTLRHCVFLRSDIEWKDVLLFHELVHVVQWRLLGERGFLRAYFRQFFDVGYAAAPLEEMAFALHGRFEQAMDVPFDAEAEIRLAVKSM